MSDERTAVGDLVDSLGITATLAEGELAEAAIVLLKIHQADGRTRLSLAYSEGLGWIERAGMLHAAQLVDDAETHASHSE